MKNCMKWAIAALLAIGHLAVAIPAVATAQSLNFTMGSSSASMYAIGVQVAEELRKARNLNVNVKSGGALGNVILIDRNKAQFGHSSSGLAFAASQGMEPFKKKLDNIRGLAKIMESSFQLLLLNNVPINSLAELKEKRYPIRLAVGAKGQELELLSRRILEANGITYDDVKSWGGRVEFVDIGDANSLIRDGHLDGVTMLSGLPNASIIEINAAREMKLVSLSDQTISTLVDKFGYVPAVIAGGIYKGIDNDTRTVAGGVVLLTNSTMSDELAYELTKAICSDQARARLATMSGSIKIYLTSEKACATGVGIALHTGAEKYFRETGAIK